MGGKRAATRNPDEVDGNVHEIPENQAYDIERSEILNDFGIKVIRFTNEQIIDDFERKECHSINSRNSIIYKIMLYKRKVPGGFKRQKNIVGINVTM